MKIQKRILVTNTRMVLVSLLALFFTGGILINMFGHQYLIQNNKKFNNSDVFKVERLLDAIEFETVSFDELSNELKKYNYELYISKDSNKIYSNISNEAKKSIEYINSMDASSDSQIFTNGFIILINKNISINGEQYKFSIVTNLQTMIKKSDINYQTFFVKFIIFGSISILVILLISQIFTKGFTKRIVTPINKLISSAERIENGDFSTFIDYKGEDEFEMLCKSFNEMQKHLKDEREKNLAYEKARTDMIAGLSHDLRTPLTSVKGYIKGMIDGIANTEEKREIYLNRAYKKATDMEVLLQKLFFFSKLETKNLPFFFRNTDLVEFTQKFVIQANQDLKMNNAKVKFKSDVERVHVYIDIEHMIRVLINLIENSIKYAKSDNIEILLKIETDIENVLLIISDNGIGVSDDKLDNLFEQFYRVDESRSLKNGEGSGLGLYIVKSIIESHKGTVKAENDNGLKITITLPIKEEKNE